MCSRALVSVDSTHAKLTQHCEQPPGVRVVSWGPMENEEFSWAPAVGAAILLVLLTSLTLVAAGGWQWFASFLAGQASGWAQAIGSVVAIGVAYRLGQTQMQADRALEADRRAHEDHRRLAAIHVAIRGLERALSPIKDTMDRFDPPVFVLLDWHRQQIRNAAATVASIHPFDCPDADLMPLMSLLPGLAESFSERLAEYMKVCDNGGLEDVKRACPSLYNGFNVVWSATIGARDGCKRALDAVSEQR
jgi:hypothetical protein